jgi:signal transduction histidine kinase
MSTWSSRSIAALHTLAGAGERVLEERDLPSLYERVVQIALAELPADCVTLTHWDGESDYLPVLAVAGLPAADLAVVRLEGSLDGWVATHCEGLVIDASVADATGIYEALRRQDIQSAVGVPLVGQGRVLGVLGATRRLSQAGFTLAERDFLALLAGQLGIVLERVRLYAALMRDAGERRQSAQRLAQTEKLAGMGRLAASIAHEINNPLQALHNSFHLLLNRPLADDKRTLYLGMAQEQVERLVSLVQRMLNYYQPARDGMRPTALHPLLEQVLRAESKHFEAGGITIERDWFDGLPRVLGISSHLKQVFQNLTLNAVEAMSAGGRLVVRTRILEGNGDNVARSVLIEFSDNGPGIPVGELQAIFEPFYTTKANNTGLGLAISYSIVEQHGGVLSVYRDDEQTTFRVTLPVLSSASGPAELLTSHTTTQEVQQ